MKEVNAEYDIDMLTSPPTYRKRTEKKTERKERDEPYTRRTRARVQRKSQEEEDASWKEEDSDSDPEDLSSKGKEELDDWEPDNENNNEEEDEGDDDDAGEEELNDPMEEDEDEDEEDDYVEVHCREDELDAVRVDNHRVFPEFVGPVGKPVVGVRKSKRLAENGLRSAFRFLTRDDYIGFLQCTVIQSLFAPAFESFTKFGQGHAADVVEEHWNLCWTNQVRTAPTYRVVQMLIQAAAVDPTNQVLADSLTNFGRALNDSHCIFCRLPRNLTVCSFDCSGDAPIYQGLIGTDCWNIRFRPLVKLVETCKRLALSVDHPNFELNARYHIEIAIEEIKMAPVKMAEAYSHLRK